MFVPGIITPAEIAFGALRDSLGDDRELVLHDLAVYDHGTPPLGYGLGHEVAGILSKADRCGIDKFHLVGFSGGGASAAAFAASHGNRLSSLTLIEPAWLGNEDMSAGERRAFEEEMSSAEMTGPDALAKFAALNLAEGVKPPAPPPGDPPDWMAKRPAAIRAIGPAFLDYRLELQDLRALTCPVLYVLGTLSAKMYAERAERARQIFANFRLEIFEGRHHFDPPHRSEVPRMTRILNDFWSAAE